MSTALYQQHSSTYHGISFFEMDLQSKIMLARDVKKISTPKNCARQIKCSPLKMVFLTSRGLLLHVHVHVQLCHVSVSGA